MDKQTPSKPQRKGSTKAKTTAMDEPTKMKYAPREKVGTPKLGSPVTVKTVGLGNLEVITQNGYTNV
jgi:hypothetical protein